ncbi:hypothetical protein JCM21900_006367 [Sporobolomyces salmonicolor]
MASAPPSDDAELRSKPFVNVPPVLSGERVVKAIALAAADDKALLLSLARVSQGYNKLEKLNTSLDSNPSLGNFVSGLTITPLDAPNPVSSASFLIPPLQRLVSRFPNLTALDEDFTATEWDVCTLSGNRLPPQSLVTKQATCSVALSSVLVGDHRAVVSQPQLQELVLGGAAMDRDWDGVQLEASLSGQLASEAPGRNLTSLDIAQIMHEGALAVVLLLASGGVSSSTPLESLQIGFQSVSRSLEGSESSEVLPVPIGSGRTLSLLPKTLRVLRARGLVSVSTSKVLGMLDHPEGIPVLEELDVVWATGTGGEEEKRVVVHTLPTAAMESTSAPGPSAPAPVPGPSSPASSPAATANAHASASRGSGNLSAYLLQPDNPYPSPLSGTQDLISLFHLEPLYNTFLRPYLTPPPPASGAEALPPPPPTGADSPAAPFPGAVGSIKGKEKAFAPAQVQGVESPSPGGPGAGAGLKITLGGIKFGGAPAARAGGADAAAAAAAAGPGPGGAPGGGKPKKLKMDKSYAHMVSDILGRNTIKKSLDLSHLVLNPDPTPCPPLHPFDAQQLRDAFTLKPGGLAGFDMGVWEKDVVGAGGEPKKKKKKRKADAGGDPNAQGGGDHKRRKSGG